MVEQGEALRAARTTSFVDARGTCLRRRGETRDEREMRAVEAPCVPRAAQHPFELRRFMCHVVVARADRGSCSLLEMQCMSLFWCRALTRVQRACVFWSFVGFRYSRFERAV